MLRHILSRLFNKLHLRVLLLDEMESLRLRRYFMQKHQVDVGMYSYGCFDPIRIPARTRIGRYCSFARTARIIDANHPTEALTTHPFLYDPRFGMVNRTVINPDWIVIEDDVWVGHNAIITAGCKHIGRGAIIGAGAIVTRDVLPYTIMAGVPATMRRRRFSDEIIAQLENSRWWELDKAALAALVGRNQEILLRAGDQQPDFLARALAQKEA